MVLGYGMSVQVGWLHGALGFDVKPEVLSLELLGLGRPDSTDAA